MYPEHRLCLDWDQMAVRDMCVCVCDYNYIELKLLAFRVKNICKV